MIFPDLSRLVFFIMSIILVLLLIVLTYLMYKHKNEYKNNIAIMIFIGIASIIFYNFFLLSKNHNMAVFFDTLFFIGTDWLAMFMFMFTIKYTEILLNKRKIISLVCSICCGIDTVSLFVNNWTYHMFDLIILETANHFKFWGNDFHFLHYCHLGMCYVMVGAAFLCFVISLIKSSELYKEKYIGIFVSYLIVIVVNCISYTLNLPFDFSVILYAFLAGFICFYSTYTFPHKLLGQSLHAINETVSDAVLYFNIEGDCVYANTPAKKIFSTHDTFNLTSAELYHQKLLEEIGDQYVLFKKDSIERQGEIFHYEVEFHKEYSTGYVIGSFLRLSDKTEEIALYEKEKFEATHDELTGIYNRIGFIEEVEKSIKEYGCENKVLLCSNIKDFKLINELFGEETGDKVLLKQASLLQEFSHESNIFGRIGEDKFALFCDKSLSKEEDLIRYIKTLQKTTESTVYHMHVCVGIYEPHDPNETVQMMCDKALMAEKHLAASGNYSQIFAYYDSNLMEIALNEKNILEDFETAIEKNQIEMYLQPIIDTKNNKFGAEALCRWNHPLRGLMYPADFISILEKNGLIYLLDEYIWELAAKKLHEWNVKGCNDCYISVNVSVKDFFYTDIYKTFTRLSQIYDINPACLHIEITEKVLMSDFEKASALALKLQKAGFSVAIDNFGNGYSSLNMLKDFEADILKIDMSFINSNQEMNKNQIIVESIIKMADSLEMYVVGEGVESKEQYDILRDYNCLIFQGNYLSEPLTIEEYEDKFVKFFFTEK